MKNRLLLSSIVVAASVGVASIAWAGYKANNVYPVTVSSSSGYAYGALGDVRASSDTNQYIGCSAQYNGSAYWVHCSANDSTGSNYVACSTSDVNYVNIVQTMNNDSYLYFAWNTSTGACTTVQVYNYSYFSPKQP